MPRCRLLFLAGPGAGSSVGQKEVVLTELLQLEVARVLPAKPRFLRL